MKSILIADSTRELLRAHLPSDARFSAGVWVGHAWQVEVDDDVYDRLLALSRNMDTAIRLVCTHQYGTS